MEDEVEEENEVAEGRGDGVAGGAERGLVGGYLRTAASVSVYPHLRIFASVFMCMYVCIHIHMYVCLYVYACMCVRASCATTRAHGSGVGGAYGCTWTDTRCGRVRV